MSGWTASRGGQSRRDQRPRPTTNNDDRLSETSAGRPPDFYRRDFPRDRRPSPPERGFSNTSNEASERPEHPEGGARPQSRRNSLNPSNPQSQGAPLRVNTQKLFSSTSIQPDQPSPQTVRPPERRPVTFVIPSTHIGSSKSVSPKTSEAPSLDPRKRAREVVDKWSVDHATKPSSSPASPLPTSEGERASPLPTAMPHVRADQDSDMANAFQVTKNTKHTTPEANVDIEHIQIPPDLSKTVGEIKDIFQNIITSAVEVLTLEQKLSTAEVELNTATVEAEQDRVKLAKYPPLVDQSEFSRRVGQIKFSTAEAALSKARTQRDEYSKRALYRVLQLVSLNSTTSGYQMNDSFTSSVKSLMADHTALKKKLTDVEDLTSAAGAQRDDILKTLQEEVSKLSDSTARDTVSQDLQERLQRVEKLPSRQAAIEAVEARVTLMETQLKMSGGLVRLQNFDILQNRVEDLSRKQSALNLQRTNESAMNSRLDELQSLCHSLDTRMITASDSIAKLQEDIETKQPEVEPVYQQNLDALESKFVDMVQTFANTNSNRYGMLAGQVQKMKDDFNSRSSPQPAHDQHPAEEAHMNGPQADVSIVSDLRTRIDGLATLFHQHAGSLGKTRGDIENDRANGVQRYETLAQIVNQNSNLSKIHFNKMDALDHSLWNLNARFNNLTTEQMVQAMWRQFSTIYPHAAEAQAEFRKVSGLSKTLDTATAAVANLEVGLNKHSSTLEHMATKANIEDLKGQLQNVEAMAKALTEQNATKSRTLDALETKTDAKCDVDALNALQHTVTEVTQQFQDAMANVDDQLGILRKAIAHSSAINRGVSKRSSPNAVDASRTSETPKARKASSDTESATQLFVDSEGSGTSEATTIHPVGSDAQATPEQVSHAQALEKIWTAPMNQARGRALSSRKESNGVSSAQLQSSEPVAEDNNDDYLEIWRTNVSPTSSPQETRRADAARPTRATSPRKRKETSMTRDDADEETWPHKSWSPAHSGPATKKRLKQTKGKKTVR